ncbi:MAG: type II toxin-antitoxin system PemK/MazF family toxin [Caulobacteraceae bacterium]|nr:type II toxin-antitoxin system PemK/MazF family toxin [Caulobacteraceae bacterium]
MRRFEIWLVRLDPVLGSEIGKTRPGVIVSPDEANGALHTVLIAPLTSVRRAWPTRIPLLVNGVEGDAALDQIRAVDKRRLVKSLGDLTPDQCLAVAQGLAEMFRL